ncbi:MAG: segregation/condensation protein A [Candidatus Aenigmarchaeota archaeon]|nr:segregation/condensation protein A [Candidatus Aenigmarchaeota archaeon]
MEEKDIVKMASTESNWEEILEYIITEEGMDPWDINIVKLANALVDYISKMEILDFKVPSRIIIISAILLRMKVVLLLEEQEKKEEEEKKDEEGLIDLSKVPDLETPIKRISRRKVTLEELVSALSKAFKTKEIRETKQIRARRRVEELIEDEEDIEERIEKLYQQINGILDELKGGEMTFDKLVPKWERDIIVNKFLPLLHLIQTGKISCEQKEIFKDIYIKLKGDTDE